MNFKKVFALGTACAMTASMSVAALADTQVIELNAPVTYNTPFVATAADLGFTGSALAVTLDGLNNNGENGAVDETQAYWNDWCSLTIVVQDDNGIAYYPVVGGEVGWDITVAGAETADDDSDDVVVKIDDVQYKMEKLGTNIMAKVPVSGDYTVMVKSNGWNDEGFADSASVQVTSIAVLDAAEYAAAADGEGAGDAGDAGEAEGSGDVAPIAFLAAMVAVAGVAMVASKKRA